MSSSKPLSDDAKVALAASANAMRQLRAGMVTPQDWAQIAMREAFELIGSDEGAAKMAECRRYLACDELITRLREEVSSLNMALDLANQELAEMRERYGR